MSGIEKRHLKKSQLATAPGNTKVAFGRELK